MATLTDNLQLERLSQGDVASFETIFYRHYDRIYGLLFRLTGNRSEAEDLTQEVFLKLYHHTFKTNKEHNIGAWLYRVATNMGYDALRKRRRAWERDTLLVPDPHSSKGADTEVEKREQATAVRATLARLTKRQVQLLLLRQMEVSYADCAAICDVAPGSVGTLLARAAEAFRREYQKVSGEEQ